MRIAFWTLMIFSCVLNVVVITLNVALIGHKLGCW